MSDGKGKFKVGDRVEIVGGNTDKQRFVGTFFTIDTNEGDLEGEQCWSGKDNKSPYRYKESELRLAPASPIRTVTHREIVPGRYGVVTVDVSRDGRTLLDLWKANANAEELREAAHLFNQLAEVLEENTAESKAA